MPLNRYIPASIKAFFLLCFTILKIQFQRFFVNYPFCFFLPVMISATANTSSTSVQTNKSGYPYKKKICISGCRYDVVCRVALERGFKIVSDNDMWNLNWSDTPLSPEKITEIRRIQNTPGIYPPVFQKMNHFPGMYEICRKDRLGRNLNRLKRVFPNDYNFFPTTWDLPSDIADLLEYWKRNKNATFIVKPDSGCQGKGIFLVKNLKTLCPFAKCVCQLYISQPLLMDGYKYDMRIYVLITCVDPLRIYVYKEGLARFATVKYQSPKEENLDVIFMHLTNYSLNKFSESYDNTQTGVGSKRTLCSVYDQMRKDVGSHKVEKLKASIDDVIIKTIVCVSPTLRHNYRASFPKRDRGCSCFELLGFDILVDRNFKPMLVEVNHSPSYNLDLMVDDLVKTALVRDLFGIIYLGDKSEGPSLSKNQKFNIQRRPGTPFASHISDSLKDQFVHEEQNQGDFRLVFTEDTPGKYAQFLDKEYCIPTFEEEQSFLKKRSEVIISDRGMVEAWSSRPDTQTSLKCTRNGEMYVETKPATPGVLDHDSFLKFRCNTEKASNYINGPFTAVKTLSNQRPIFTARKTTMFEKPPKQLKDDDNKREYDNVTSRGSTAVKNTTSKQDACAVLTPSERVQKALNSLRQKSSEKHKFITAKNNAILRTVTASSNIKKAPALKVVPKSHLSPVSTATEVSFRTPSPYLHEAIELEVNSSKKKADASMLPSMYQQIANVQDAGKNYYKASNEADFIKGWLLDGSVAEISKKRSSKAPKKVKESIKTIWKMDRSLSHHLERIKQQFEYTSSNLQSQLISAFNPTNALDTNGKSQQRNTSTERNKEIENRPIVEIAGLPNRNGF